MNNSSINNLSIVILAAGKGTRMNSELPKVLHEINKKPLIHYVLEKAAALSDKIILVIGYKAKSVKSEINNKNIKFALQEPQLGTGHALMQAKPFFNNTRENILVLYGDMPLIKSSTLQNLIKLHKKQNNDATILTAVMNPTPAYGRIIRDANGKIKEIIEEKDASPEIKKIKEVNSGIYIFKSEIFSILEKIKPNNSQKEYYLTDAIRLLVNKNKKVSAFQIKNQEELHGINNPEELKKAEEILAGYKTQNL